MHPWKFNPIMQIFDYCVMITWNCKWEAFLRIATESEVLPPTSTVVFCVKFRWSIGPIPGRISRFTITGSLHFITTNEAVLPLRALSLCSQLRPVQFPSRVHWGLVDVAKRRLWHDDSGWLNTKPTQKKNMLRHKLKSIISSYTKISKHAGCMIT